MRTLLLLAAAALATGCAAYRLGGTDPAFREIALRPAVAEVARPGVLPAVDQALRASLAADARLRLRAAGAPLEVRVVDYRREAVTRSATDTYVTTYYRVTLRIRASLRSPDGRRAAFVDRPFESHAVLEAAGDLAGDESRALPRLAAEVAAQVRDAALGAW